MQARAIGRVVASVQTGPSTVICGSKERSCPGSGSRCLARLTAKLPSVSTWLAAGGGHLQLRPFMLMPYIQLRVRQWRDEPALSPLLHRLRQESLALRLGADQLLSPDNESGVLRLAA